MIRLLAFFVLLLSVLHLPLWFFLPLAIGYTFYFRAYELLFLAGCVDAYYGSSGSFSFSYYTAITLSIVLLIEYLRPFLNINDKLSS